LDPENITIAAGSWRVRVEQARTAEAALDHRHGRHVAHEGVPQPDAGAADEDHRSGDRRVLGVERFEALDVRGPSQRIGALGDRGAFDVGAAASDQQRRGEDG
jgi:hypothetical protein